MTRLQNQVTMVAVAFWLLSSKGDTAEVDPPALEWEMTYSLWEPDTYDSPDFQQTLDGGYILVCGCSLIKTDQDGQLKWSWENDMTEATWDRASYGRVYQSQDLGYVLSYFGAQVSAVPADSKQIPVLTKIDPNGNMIGKVTLRSSQKNRTSYCLDATLDGGSITGGFHGFFTKTGDWALDPLLIKTDSAGTEVWSRTYGGESGDICFSVHQTIDGGYILGGATTSFGCGDDGFWDAYLVKTDSQGNEQWFKTYSDKRGNLNPSYVNTTSDGGYVVSGGASLISVIKSDLDGNEQWRRSLMVEWTGAPGCVGSVQQTCDGGYIISGWIGHDGFEADPYIVKTDAMGRERWIWTAGRRGLQCRVLARQTIDGGYAVSANVLNDSGHVSSYLAKLAPDGDCKPQNPPFRRGDSGTDGVLQLTDAVFTVNHLFLAGPRPSCLDAADADDNGAIQITDAILTLNHLFLGGPALPEPFGSCGSDSTPDDLGCAAFSACQ